MNNISKLIAAIIPSETIHIQAFKASDVKKTDAEIKETLGTETCFMMNTQITRFEDYVLVVNTTSEENDEYLEELYDTLGMTPVFIRDEDCFNEFIESLESNENPADAIYHQIYADAFHTVQERLKGTQFDNVMFLRFCEEHILGNIEQLRETKGDFLACIEEDEAIIIRDNETGATEVFSYEKTVMFEEILKVI